MNNPFFEKPILNSPYEYPSRHWELDDTGQPTQKVIDNRAHGGVYHAYPEATEAQRAGQANLVVCQ